MFTVAEVERLMDKGVQTGEDLGGRYFWCSDGLIVREPGIDNHGLQGLAVVDVCGGDSDA